MSDSGQNCIYVRLSPRANRVYQPLKYSMIRGGIEVSPAHLFGLEKCKCILEKGSLVYEHAPSIEFQTEFPKNNFQHFIRNVRSFDKDIIIVRDIVAKIQILLGSDDWQYLFELCQQGFDVVYRNIFLAQYIDEIYATQFLEFTASLNESTRAVLVNKVLSSAFTRNALAGGSYLRSEKSFSANPHPIIIWSGWIENIDGDDVFNPILNDDDIKIEEKQLILLCNYIYQCAEAFGFIANLITTACNWILISVSKQLSNKYKLTSINELFEWNVSRIKEQLKSL